MKAVVRFVAALSIAGAVAAHAAEWKSDPAGSKLEFIPTYQGEKAPGVFKEFDVELALDDKKPTANRLKVVVKTASADMSNSDMNEAIAGSDWFDVKKHPTAQFVATDVKPDGAAGRYVARGKLTIKGTEKDATVPFTFAPSGDKARMEGELSIERTQFNVGAGDWAEDDTIGRNVGVKFSVNLRKAK